jgi:class 3 adenylate cyclase
LTALGDPVNVTARLAAQAGAGDVLVSADAAEAAGLHADLPRRSLPLKGRQDPVEVVTLRLDEPPDGTRSS